LNGAARVLEGAHRSVTLSGAIADQSGNRHVFLSAELSARGRLSLYASVAGGAGEDLNPSGIELLHRVLSVPKLAQAVRELGGQAAGWPELYKAYELLSDAAGGEPTLIKKFSLSRSAVSAFRASANRADVSGSDARHAVNKGAPPAHTLTIAEGRAFIFRLIATWPA